MKNAFHKIPIPGMRNIKTAICILICLLIDYLLGSGSSLYSAIAAIVCMQSTIENTFITGINRLVGTAIGGGMGLLLIPVIEMSSAAYVLLIPTFTILAIYLCNIVKRPGSSTICAIVFIGMFVLPGQGINPYYNALMRILETVIGIVVAMAVNRFIAPPRKRAESYPLGGSFAYIDDQIAHALSGRENLFIYAKDDVHYGYIRKNKSVSSSITLPVPTEFSDKKVIYAVFIDKELRVTHFHVKVRFGFADIPARFLPGIIVWKAEQKERKSFLLR